MSVTASANRVSGCCLGGIQKDMGGIASLTKSNENQDFSTEGVTKGVEDDVFDDGCVLSEKRFNIDPSKIMDKVGGDSVIDGNGFMTNKNFEGRKEESLAKCLVQLQEKQFLDHVEELVTDGVHTTHIQNEDINNGKMPAENTKMHYDKCGESFSSDQDKLLESRFDNKTTKDQVTKGNSFNLNNASCEKKCQIKANVLKTKPEIISCAKLTDEIPKDFSVADRAYDSSNNNNENHRRSNIIETLMNILGKKQKQLENNRITAGDVTSSTSSQHVNNKIAKNGYFHSVSSFLSIPPSEIQSQDTEANKLQRSSVIPKKIVPDGDKARKQLKSAVERVTSQLEKLQQILEMPTFISNNSFASTISENMKNQIKGMKTAVLLLHNIVGNTPQQNLNFADILIQMTTQLSKTEEEILKIHHTTQDPVVSLLHFQKSLDTLKEDGVKAEDTASN